MGDPDWEDTTLSDGSTITSIVVGPAVLVPDGRGGMQPIPDDWEAQNGWDAETDWSALEPDLIPCPHWSPGEITMRKGCTACAAEVDQ